MSEVVLRVDGVEYGGWTSVRVERSMERLCGVYELGVTDRWPGSAPMPIKPGDLCQILIDDEQVMAGLVDDRMVEYEHTRHEVRLRGRDATGDLVDCSAQPVQIRGRTLMQIAKQACEPFGIPVRADVDLGAAFTSVDFEPGQTVQELLAELAAHRGVLLMTDQMGSLIITRESDRRSPGHITAGDNVLSCQAEDSMRDRYRDYTVLVQDPQSDTWHGDPAAGQKASARDDMVKRHRPLSVLAQDGSDLKRRAIVERNVRAGQARRITYTLSGWRAADGVLWQPNTIVPVTDPMQSPALDATPMLIASVAFILDDGGQRTEITVMPRGAFDLAATPEDSGF